MLHSSAIFPITFSFSFPFLIVCYPNLFLSFGNRYFLFDDAKVRRIEQLYKEIPAFSRKTPELLINVKPLCACTRVYNLTITSDRFDQMMEKSEERRGSVDFSREIAEARAILSKANF